MQAGTRDRQHFIPVYLLGISDMIFTAASISGKKQVQVLQKLSPPLNGDLCRWFPQTVARKLFLFPEYRILNFTYHIILRMPDTVLSLSCQLNKCPWNDLFQRALINKNRS